MTVKPISPDLIVVARDFPDQVITAFNELIAEKFSGGEATVKQDDVIKRIMAKMPDVTRSEIFERGWLNVEETFEEAGWNVVYDKPGYNENYGAFFIFKKPRTNAARTK